MTDIELINRVKEEKDSAALTELIERHSGMYVKMVQRYACVERNSPYGSAKLDTHELKDDKAFNIYQFVLSYDPNRNMKFSTYVGEMTRYHCLDILNDRKILSNHSNKVEVTEDTPLTSTDSDTSQPSDNTLQSIRARTKSVTDDRFWTIFDLRHFKDGGGYTWRTIGQRIGLTHECARQIYNRNIKHIKYHLIK
jgi:RNA polymerase sigma factor (sigma-70 family)